MRARNYVAAATVLLLVAVTIAVRPGCGKRQEELPPAPPATPAAGGLLETKVISPGFVTQEIYRDNIPAKKEGVLAVRYVYRVKGHIVPPIQTILQEYACYVVTFMQGRSLPDSYLTAAVPLPLKEGWINVNGISYKTQTNPVVEWKEESP